MIRVATQADEPFLVDMLYEALFVPPGRPPPPRSVLTSPELLRYVHGFGTRPGDVGCVAETPRAPIGAAWVRLLTGTERGYGYVDDRTPELTIAVMPQWRGRGLGSALLSGLITRVPRMSLSCDIRNPAMRLYGRFGFAAVSEAEASVTLLLAP